MTRYNPQKVKTHLSYTMQQAAHDIGASIKTIDRWIEKGLPIVPGSKRPILIMGNDLKEFIRNKNSKRKVRLQRHQFFCFRCRAAREAERGTIETVGRIRKGLCHVCGGKMLRTISPSQKAYSIPTSPVQMSIFNNKPNNHETNNSRS